MATHSSILAWEMPRTEEPDGPHSMGPIRVGLNPATTNRSISKDHTRVCVCVSVCVCVCARMWCFKELKGKSHFLRLQKSCSFKFRHTDWFKNYVIIYKRRSF